ATISFGTTAGARALIHTAATAGITSVIAPRLSDASSHLFVTPLSSPTLHVPSPVGVTFDRGAWTLFTEDRRPLPAGAHFNLAVAQGGFTHRADAHNISKHVTTLDLPNANGRPDAL